MQASRRMASRVIFIFNFKWISDQTNKPGFSQLHQSILNLPLNSSTDIWELVFLTSNSDGQSQWLTEQLKSSAQGLHVLEPRPASAAKPHRCTFYFSHGMLPYLRSAACCNMLISISLCRSKLYDQNITNISLTKEY